MRYSNYMFHVPDEKICRVIIDTDAANEGDDQFAAVHAMLSPRFDNVGFIAAHYGAENSMERSYDELLRLFSALECPFSGIIKKGAPHPLLSKSGPVVSEGSALIVEEAMKDDPRPLYVLFLGPLTDLASAYLQEPRIAGRFTAIWIGGGTYPYGNAEFNLGNDVNAVNVVFEMMGVSFAELQYRLCGKSKAGDYLFSRIIEEIDKESSLRSPFRTGETWVLGDSPAVGLVLYEHRWEFDYVNAPVIGDTMEYIPSKLNRPIRVYRRIDSRLILEDMYAKIALFDPACWK